MKILSFGFRVPASTFLWLYDVIFKSFSLEEEARVFSKEKNLNNEMFTKSNNCELCYSSLKAYVKGWMRYLIEFFHPQPVMLVSFPSLATKENETEKISELPTIFQPLSDRASSQIHTQPLKWVSRFSNLCTGERCSYRYEIHSFWRKKGIKSSKHKHVSYDSLVNFRQTSISEGKSLLQLLPGWYTQEVHALHAAALSHFALDTQPLK